LIFIEIGLDPNTAFLAGPVTRNGAREIVCAAPTFPAFTPPGTVSSVPEKQIIIAAGEGFKAALNAWEYLMVTRMFQ
jgi:alkyl hydroperoxide reductase subunit F